MRFNILEKSSNSFARRTEFETAHGTLQTPFFMTIATKAAVKSLGLTDLEILDPQIILSNTYHLFLRPGMDCMKKAGGLHSFMSCDRPILTDSGGYQVFSLSSLRTLTEEGVRFQSHLDGSYHMLTPERAIEIQQTIGSDIMMCLDECPPYPCDKNYAETSLGLTTRWAVRCKEYKNTHDGVGPTQKQLLFGIVQGGTFLDLRKESARQLMDIGFDGYAVGGLAVGEPRSVMYEILENLVPLLPEDKPRYLMGVGYPEEIVQAVLYGIDMFDCVIPTREGRHGRLFRFQNGKTLFDENFYDKINATKAEFSNDFSPINPESSIPELRIYTRAYLHHLFKTGEILGMRLATLNNVEFYLDLMKRIRKELFV